MPTCIGRRSSTATPVLGVTAKRCRVFRGQALLRLWSRQRADVSARRRRDDDPDGRAGHAAGGVPAPGRTQADDLLRRADALCGHAGRRPSCRTRDDVALRRCVSAGEALPREVGERFAARFGCEILDGIGSTEMLHIFLSNLPGEVRYGTTGKPVPGYDIELRGEDGRPVGVDAIGDLYIRGPVGRPDVLGEPRALARDVPGRVDEKRRQVHARRRWLLHVCRTQRRHAQGERPVRVAVRGRGRADAARSGAGGRGRRQDRRRRTHQDARVSSS